MINMKKKISKVLTYKRGNLWAYRFESAPVDGKRKWITKSGFKNQSEAYEAGMQHTHNINRLARASLHLISLYLITWITGLIITARLI